ncbi:polysaccharide deacetylase family protein [Mammaliicoccus sciuri]
MKKRIWGLLGVLFALLFILGSMSVDAAVTNDKRYIGLHDRILPIDDVSVIGNNTRVPLGKIAKFLYLPLEIEDGVMHVRKRGADYTYDYATKETRKDGILQTSSPIVELNGKLYITVTYIADELGFKTHYFPKFKTLRIYRDDYKHMPHANFESVIKKHMQAKPEDSGKANVYLTFDDGPNRFTSANTAILKKYNVKGTFFFIGNQMKDQQKIFKETAAAGHYIGSHSMTHDANKVYQTTKSFMDEMNKGLRLIEQITGNDTKLVRVPYGSKPYVTAAMRNELIRYDYKLWDWNVDSEDWKYTNQQAGRIVKNIQTGVKKAYATGNRNIVILMHDRSQTAKVLPEIIEWLQAQGYVLKPYDPAHHTVNNFYADKRL